MKTIQIIQFTQEEFQQVIADAVRKELQDVLKSQNKQQDEELLTRFEAAEFLKINQSTLWSYTKQGKIPAFSIGHRVYYKKTDLLNSLTPINK